MIEHTNNIEADIGLSINVVKSPLDITNALLRFSSISGPNTNPNSSGANS